MLYYLQTSVYKIVQCSVLGSNSVGNEIIKSLQPLGLEHEVRNTEYAENPFGIGRQRLRITDANEGNFRDRGINIVQGSQDPDTSQYYYADQ